MFGLQGAPTKPNSFVEVTLGAVFQDKIGVSLTLEVVNEIDKMRMILQDGVAIELLRTLVCNDSVWAGRGTRLGQTLDGHLLVGQHVLGEEDHAKGAMIQRSDGLEASFQELTSGEVIFHALHCKGGDSRGVSR